MFRTKELKRKNELRWHRENIIRNRKRYALNARNRRKKNPEKYRIESLKYRNKPRQKIMNQVRWAVLTGKITKPKYCSCCGEIRKLNGHHKDYNKPLEVIWLCPACHRFLHTYLKNLTEAEKKIGGEDV